MPYTNHSMVFLFDVQSNPEKMTVAHVIFVLKSVCDKKFSEKGGRIGERGGYKIVRLFILILLFPFFW